MSLRTALLAVGLLVVGYVLFVAFLAMGPIAWVVFGTMILIGMIQVYRTQRAPDRDSESEPRFCANCGAELAFEPVDEDGDGEDGDGADGDGEDGDGKDGESSDGQDEHREYSVNFCSSCGAPVPDATDGDAGGGAERRRQNCPDCGAPNDPDLTACDYCGTAL
ncbi:Zn-ribbon domain containing protein [Halalkaliarchaeum sp. AArc-CO]|uniref:zinc ribbon domain-containing protein n=1 Tax=unclassified Halalkaliarchaeum TaxID=2678344 RepID=UPI00217EB515|nr:MULTISPECIES: zinc ribbon domain-containing protein [unclassified Halalkaliarchaeum]MDR5673116.1 zinc ribbon domain-containing protein [Halalkaliarchaeum sp. AArc-GB]UWG49580.1 Zn-ribbon domain containing protein [Halalkaliarchaeum sp. AArc-CO]